MIDGTPRRQIPATALAVALERHEAIVSALRVGAPTQIQGPSLYRIARAVVTERGSLDLYRRARTA